MGDYASYQEPITVKKLPGSVQFNGGGGDLEATDRVNIHVLYPGDGSEIGVLNTDDLYVNRDAYISGNLYVIGNTTSSSTNTLVIDDPIIELANNAPDGTTMGLVMQRPSGNVMMGYLSTENSDCYDNTLVFSYTSGSAYGTSLPVIDNSNLSVYVHGSVDINRDLHVGGNLCPGTGVRSDSTLIVNTNDKYVGIDNMNPAYALDIGTPSNVVVDTTTNEVKFASNILIRTINAGIHNIAIGSNAGSINQISSIAIGSGAGFENQNAYSIAMGSQAGYTGQYSNSVAIGTSSGNTGQQDKSVALGFEAGYTGQYSNSVAIGSLAGYSGQKGDSIALGNRAGNQDQNADSIAIGHDAGMTNQSYSSIAIGLGAGNSNQGLYSVAIGNQAGDTSQDESSIAIGYRAAVYAQNTHSIAIGTIAGENGQYSNSVAIGTLAGYERQKGDSVAIGKEAGKTDQSIFSVALGRSAGFINQGERSVAVGTGAGTSNQGDYTVAIGSGAGSSNQNNYAVAVGHVAGIQSQGEGAVSLGSGAGSSNQGAASISIGWQSGTANTHSNTIVLNANGGVVLESDKTDAMFVKPIRHAETTYGNLLSYDTSTGEITNSSNIRLESLMSNAVIYTNASNTLSTSADFTFDETTGIMEIDGGKGGYLARALLYVDKFTTPTGIDVARGQPVYVTNQANSGKINANLCVNTSNLYMPSAGLVFEDKARNDPGYVVRSGVLDDIDDLVFVTAPVAADRGKNIYVASISGKLTFDRPALSSELIQKIGILLKTDGVKNTVLIVGADRVNDTPNRILAADGSFSDRLTVGKSAIDTSANLYVVGDTTIEDGSLYFYGTGLSTPYNDTSGRIEVEYTGFVGGQYSYMRFYTKDTGTPLTEQMVIDPIGNVGINTDEPMGLLHVRNDTNVTTTTQSALVYDGTLHCGPPNVDVNGFHLNGDCIDSGRILGSSIDFTGWAAGQEFVSTAAGGANMYFKTRSTSGTLAEKMRITSEGLVGIGTNAPNNLLTLRGTYTGYGMNFKGDGITGNDYSIMSFEKGGSSTPGLLMFQNGITRTADGGVSAATIRNDTGDLYIGNPSFPTYVPSQFEIVKVTQPGIGITHTAPVTDERWSMFINDSPATTKPLSWYSSVGVGVKMYLATNGTIQTVNGTNNLIATNSGPIYRYYGGNAYDGAGVYFGTNGTNSAVLPTNSVGTATNGFTDLGTPSFQWRNLYYSGALVPSDQNLKTKSNLSELVNNTALATAVTTVNIEEVLSNVATNIKNGIGYFKYNDMITHKGMSNARVHTGVYAQDVERIFIENGLEPGKYSLWSNTSVYKYDNEIINELWSNTLDSTELIVNPHQDKLKEMEKTYIEVAGQSVGNGWSAVVTSNFESHEISNVKYYVNHEDTKIEFAYSNVIDNSNILYNQLPPVDVVPDGYTEINNEQLLYVVSKKDDNYYFNNNQVKRFTKTADTHGMFVKYEFTNGEGDQVNTDDYLNQAFTRRKKYIKYGADGLSFELYVSPWEYKESHEIGTPKTDHLDGNRQLITQVYTNEDGTELVNQRPDHISILGWERITDYQERSDVTKDYAYHINYTELSMFLMKYSENKLPPIVVNTAGPGPQYIHRPSFFTKKIHPTLTIPSTENIKLYDTHTPIITRAGNIFYILGSVYIHDTVNTVTTTYRLSFNLDELGIDTPKETVVGLPIEPAIEPLGDRSLYRCRITESVVGDTELNISFDATPDQHYQVKQQMKLTLAVVSYSPN